VQGFLKSVPSKETYRRAQGRRGEFRKISASTERGSERHEEFIKYVQTHPDLHREAEKLTPTVYPGTGQWAYISGKAMTTNLAFSQNAGFVLHFLVEPPKLSAANDFFTTESYWGIMEGLLADSDLEARHKWFKVLQHEQMPSQYVDIELCTTETIRRMYESGKFEEGWNTSGARRLVFNTMTRLEDMLGETRFFVEIYHRLIFSKKDTPSNAFRGNRWVYTALLSGELDLEYVWNGFSQIHRTSNSQTRR
jgi:hypothetical protein